MARTRLAWLGICLVSVAAVACFSDEPADSNPESPAGRAQKGAAGPVPPAIIHDPGHDHDHEHGPMNEGVMSAEDRIQLALEQKIEFDASEVPLNEALERLENLLEISIDLDRRALDDEGTATDSMVTLRNQSRTARSILETILDQLELAWEIRREALVITTRTAAKERLETRVYNIAHLVGAAELGGATRQPTGYPAQFGGHAEPQVPAQPAVNPLILMLREHTGGPKSGSWMNVDGEGANDPVIYTGHGAASLVVRQTQAVHREIEQLLNDLSLSAVSQGALSEEAEKHAGRPIRQHRGKLVVRPRPVLKEFVPSY